jgi:hypothetical protein
MNNLQTPTVSNQSLAKPATINRLLFPHGVANLTIRVDSSMATEYRGEFYGPKPRVTQVDGVVTVDYPRFNPLIWGRRSADVALSPAVAWRLEIGDGASRLVADLQELVLVAIDVHGGVSRAELRLPRPTGTVPIRVSGGGASKLAIDSQYLGAIGGPVRLDTPDYRSVAERYDLEIGGGASSVTIQHD